MKNTISRLSISPVPLPLDVADLPTIEAEPWFQVSSDPRLFLEGPSFDRKGNLFIVSPSSGLVLRVTPQKQLSTIFEDKTVAVNGSAFHKDGRLFAVCMTGQLLTIHTESKEVVKAYPKYQGKNLAMNDLVFDMQGNIYVTDFTGSVPDPTGGVFRISADGARVEPVLLHLAMPNGVSLSPEGNALWIGESARNAVLHISLLKDGITISPVVGVTYPYYSTGISGPDSNRVDKAGNLYQAIMGQGRIIVLNSLGIPVANVLAPGRDEGRNLRTSNLAIQPGSDDGYLVTSGTDGAWICKFKALAEGLILFSHQQQGKNDRRII
jgi:lactonase